MTAVDPIYRCRDRSPASAVARRGHRHQVGDEVVGAIGATGALGGDLDDGCAHAGLDKIKDQLK